MSVLELDRAVSTEHKVRSFIIEKLLYGADNGFQNGDSLLDVSILDSTGVLELVAFLEEEFRVSIKDQEIKPENLDSVDLICAFLARKQSLTI